MIIICDNCSKKFNIDSNLIPEKGRLLQCSGCDHKWFFKKKIVNKPVIRENIDEIKLNNEKSRDSNIQIPNNVDLFDKQNKEDITAERNLLGNYDEKDKYSNLEVDLNQNKKKFNILGLIIVFIISFIAIILVLDTFQEPLKKTIPNIEFLLYSLYETINDIRLFLKDLI
jgi:predicted Zn finger-like uncharacterized protein